MKDEIVLYQPDESIQLDVLLQDETVWLTQQQMADLFQKDQSVIARHISNIFKEGELDKSNMQILHNTISKYRPTAVYNLDVIISVGYRVKSQRGTQFRRWANKVLKDYILRGYVIDQLTSCTIVVTRSRIWARSSAQSPLWASRRKQY